MSNEEDKDYSRRYMTVGWSLTGIWVISALILFYFHLTPCGFKEVCNWLNMKPNEIGDALAGMVSPVAFLWLVITALMQRQELKLQRDELRAQRKVQSQIATIQLLSDAPTFTIALEIPKFDGQIASAPVHGRIILETGILRGSDYEVTLQNCSSSISRHISIRENIIYFHGEVYDENFDLMAIVVTLDYNLLGSRIRDTYKYYENTSGNTHIFLRSEGLKILSDQHA